MKMFLLALMFAGFKLSASANQDIYPNVLELTGKPLYETAPFLSVYTEGAAPVSAALAYQFYTAGKFQPVRRSNNDFISLGTVHRDVWLAYSVYNSNDKNLLLVQEAVLSLANSIEGFLVDAQQLVQPLQMNSLAGQSPFVRLSQPVTFTIAVPAGEKRLLLFHCRNRGQLFYLFTNLFQLEAFRRYEASKARFYGIFQGIFFFIIFFNLIIYLATFDRVYVLYAVYALLIGLFVLNETGSAIYLTRFLPLGIFSAQALLLSGLATWLLLMLYFLNLQSTKLVCRAIYFFAAFDIFWALLPYPMAAPSPVWESLYEKGADTMLLANLALIFITNLARVKSRDPLAVIYGIANIPVFAAVLFYYTNALNLTNFHFGWLNPVALGLSIETFFISFGFAYRYYRIRKEKEDLLITLHQKQKDLTRQLMAVQESEQQRIAEDLHDEIGGDLAAIKAGLQHQAPAGAPAVLQMVDKTAQKVRSIAHDLMPPDFAHQPFATVLREHYDRLNRDSLVQFTFTITGHPLPFSKRAELILYRILLELTSNILKHAGATEATVQLFYSADGVEMAVEDNGKGLCVAKGDGIGLRSVRSRVAYLGGTINFDTNAQGTFILIQIPFQKDV